MIIVELIEENFLNEERYAIQFVRGKFKIKHWGRNKIKYELKSKQISPINITKALVVIDEDGYITQIEKEFNSYLNKLKSGSQLQKKYKTQNHLLRKGFELNYIIDLFKTKGIK